MKNQEQGMISMRKLSSDNLEDKVRRCFPGDRFYTAPVYARRLVSMQIDARLVATLFSAYAHVRRKNRLSETRLVSLEIVLDEYEADCPILSYIRQAYWLREAISKQELSKPMLSYLDIDEDATDEEIGFDACRSLFTGDSFFCQGTNYIPRLGEIVSDWRDGDAPVLLLMSEMGFLPYWLASCGIDCIVRCSFLPDVELAKILSPLVGGRIRAELTEKEDMYKAYTAPVSSVICLFDPGSSLGSADKRVNRQSLDVLKRLHRWHYGKVVFCTVQDRLLDKLQEKEERKVCKKLMESGWLRKIARIPSDGHRQPVVLYIDFAVKRFNGVQMVDLPAEQLSEKSDSYCWLKTEEAKKLLFTHKGFGDPDRIDKGQLIKQPIVLELTDALSGVPEYADYTCICSLDEIQENEFSLDVSRYLIASKNRMTFQLAQESRIILRDIADLIAFQELPLVSEVEDGIDCLEVEAEDLDVDGGVRLPTKQVRVSREESVWFRLQRYDILLVVRGNKDHLGKIAFLAEKIPDNWVASPSLMIIRLEKTKRVGDWQEESWYWSQEQLHCSLTSDAVTAWLKSKMRNPHASAFPTRYLKNLPMLIANGYAIAAEIFKDKQRFEILLENKREHVPAPGVPQNQVKRLI